MAKLLVCFSISLLGGSLSLAFAPYSVFPFAILAPAILLFIWLKQTPLNAFMTGLLFGLGYFGFGVYWIFISIHEFGGLPALAAFGVTSIVIVYLSLFPAFSGYFLIKRFNPKISSTLILAFPAIWVLSEWIRSWLFTGFPWLFIGYSQHNSPLAGYAPFISVYGVSLIALISAGLLCNAVMQYFNKKYQAVYLNCFAVACLWIAGGMLNLIHWSKPSGEILRVNLVQGNIPQSIKWDPEHIKKSMEVYRELSQPLLQKNSLIIWPEAAVPMPLMDAADYIQQLDDQALAAGANIILGIPIKSTKQEGYYNAIVLLGENKQVYLKRLLVPYGEYIPFHDQFAGILDIMNIPMSNFIPGHHFQGPLKVGNIKISPTICYEIAYPEISRINDTNINLLLTVTNDAWFGDSPAQAQHLEIAQMRSLEMARPVLFATNDGITAIINANGIVSESLPPKEATVLISSEQPVKGRTPWMRYGIIPVSIILLTMLLAATWLTRQSMQKVK